MLLNILIAEVMFMFIA